MINLKTKGSSEHAIAHLVHALFGIKPVCFGGKKYHSYSHNQAMSCGVCQLGFPIHGKK